MNGFRKAESGREMELLALRLEEARRRANESEKRLQDEYNKEMEELRRIEFETMKLIRALQFSLEQKDAMIRALQRENRRLKRIRKKGLS